jgi:hypothetical protein
MTRLEFLNKQEKRIAKAMSKDTLTTKSYYKWLKAYEKVVWLKDNLLYMTLRNEVGK